MRAGFTPALPRAWAARCPHPILQVRKPRRKEARMSSRHRHTSVPRPTVHPADSPVASVFTQHPATSPLRHHSSSRPAPCPARSRKYPGPCPALSLSPGTCLKDPSTVRSRCPSFAQALLTVPTGRPSWSPATESGAHRPPSVPVPFSLWCSQPRAAITDLWLRAPPERKPPESQCSAVCAAHARAPAASELIWTVSVRE